MNSIKVFISPTLISKLNALSTEYDVEVGGYLVGEIKNCNIYLKELLIPSQSVSTASVNISPQDQVRLRQKYGKLATQIIGHWHSHHNMGAYFSAVDIQQHEDKMEYTDFYVFVVSSRGQHKIKVCQKVPFKLETEDCEFYVDSLKLQMTRKQIEKLFSDNSKSKDLEETAEESFINNNGEEYPTQDDLEFDYEHR